MTSTKSQAPTFEQLIARYADDVAYVAEEKAATTPEEFIDQLEAASIRFTSLRMAGAEEVEDALVYLKDTLHDDTERQVLLNRADKLLTNVSDMRSEYADMIED